MAKAPREKARSQRERFIEAAREVSADESEKTFEQQLRAVAGGNSVSGALKKKPARSREK